MYAEAHGLEFVKDPAWEFLNADAISIKLYWRIMQEYALGMGLTLDQFDHLVKLVLERYDKIAASKAAAAPSGTGKGTKRRTGKVTSKKSQKNTQSIKTAPKKSKRSTVVPSAPIKARRSSRMLAKAAKATAASPVAPAAAPAKLTSKLRVKPSSRKRQDSCELDEEDDLYDNFSPRATCRSSRIKRRKLGFETEAPSFDAPDDATATVGDPFDISSLKISTQQDIAALYNMCAEGEEEQQLGFNTLHPHQHDELLSEESFMERAAPFGGLLDGTPTHNLATAAPASDLATVEPSLFAFDKEKVVLNQLFAPLSQVSDYDTFEAFSRGVFFDTLHRLGMLSSNDDTNVAEVAAEQAAAATTNNSDLFELFYDGYFEYDPSSFFDGGGVQAFVAALMDDSPA